MPVSNISEARKAASRANGAKSRGPITQEGKARSSMNSLRHGAAMKALLLTDECKEAAKEVIEEYVADLNPTCAIERDIVEMIALHHWQYNRVQAIQTGYFNNAAARHNDFIGTEFAEADPMSRLAEVFRHMNLEDDTFRLLMRYTNDIRRALTAKLRDLKLVQSMRNQQHTVDEEPTGTQPEENPLEPGPAPENPAQSPEIDPQTPRNALCPCLSGLKYKRCCGPKAPPVLGRAA